MWTDILFDLDGTLTNSAEGIVNSVKYAMQRLGRPLPPDVELPRFIGPPLADSFKQVCALPDADIPHAIAVFREYFAEKGMFENELYPGIRRLLPELRRTGHRLFVATNKLEHFAVKILEHFEVLEHFTAVAGSQLDGPAQDKGGIIRRLVGAHGILPASAVMVGDREHDMLGARQNGMASIGVLYGFGTRQELTDAGAGHLASSVKKLGAILLSQ